jgi:hypothetical protein
MRVVSRVLAAALIAAGLALLPAAAANAGTSYTVEWITPDMVVVSATYSCSGGAQTDLGYAVEYVSNGCSDRVWLHEDTSGGGGTYCINPGAEVYGFGIDELYFGYGFEQVEPTNNGAACDAGVTFGIAWADGSSGPYECVDGYNVYDGSASGYAYVLAVTNTCNTRIWIHLSYTATSAAVACISPGSTWNYGTNGQNDGTLGGSVLVTANQAPCAAGDT